MKPKKTEIVLLHEGGRPMKYLNIVGVEIFRIYSDNSDSQATLVGGRPMEDLNIGGGGGGLKFSEFTQITPIHKPRL